MAPSHPHGWPRLRCERMGTALLLAFSVSLHADQPRVVLGQHARVELEIIARGAPADASLELWTSAGRLSEVRRESAEIFRATYFPPPEHFPRVALLLATLRAGGARERGWLAIPLIASERLPVQTKPKSQVELAIGTTVYGPVRTNASGKVRVAVKVPPGIRTARVRVRDPFGNVNDTTVDLRPPHFARLKLIASADRASWADPEPVPLEVFAVMPDGRPASAADLVLSTDRGQLGAPVEKAPGVFQLSFRAPEKAGGRATVRAAVTGDARGETASFEILPGLPAQVRLQASPPELAGGGEIRLVADVLDARGNPLPPQAVEFSTDAGALEPQGTTALLRIRPSYDGRKEIRVAAKAGAVEATLAIPLRSGSAANATVRLAQSTVREGQSVDATVELRDAGGNLVPGATLEVLAEGAEVEPPREVREGVYAVRVRTHVGDAPGPARLRVRSGSVSELVGIGILRDEHPDGIALGALFGGQSNLSRAKAALIQAEVAAHPGIRAFEVVARAGLFQFASAHDSFAGFSQRGDLRGLSLGAGIRATLPLYGRLSLHATALGGALRTFGTLTLESGPASGVRQGTAQWGPYGSVAVGASLRAGAGRAVAELQVTHAPASGDLTGNVGGVGVSLGYLFTLR
jgi:hypothetical protein